MIQLRLCGLIMDAPRRMAMSLLFTLLMCVIGASNASTTAVVVNGNVKADPRSCGPQLTPCSSLQQGIQRAVQQGIDRIEVVSGLLIAAKKVFTSLLRSMSSATPKMRLAPTPCSIAGTEADSCTLQARLCI